MIMFVDAKLAGYKPGITKPEYAAKNRVGRISIKKSVISSEIAE
jgi:hypothetical protein